MDYSYDKQIIIISLNLQIFQFILMDVLEEKEKSNSVPQRKYSKKTFQISNSAGKLFIEVNAFQRYFFVIVTYANLLKVDGSIQLVHPTPYNVNPSVINITSCQTTSEDICKKLGKELNCPIVLSFNIQLNLNKKGEDQLYHALLQILSPMK